MTRNEFLTRLAAALEKQGVADREDIVEEYEQHFAFKLADGYAEEEIAARLGEPEALAAQFEPAQKAAARRPAVLTWLWLVWADLFFGIFAVLMLSWLIVMGACALSFGAAGGCLVGGLNWSPVVSLPPMPYWCGAILGLSMLALCVLTAAGCGWFWAFFRQLCRSYGRFHRNALAAGRAEAVLPGLPMAPQLSPKSKRRLRTVVLTSLVLFAVCFVLSFAACSLSAGSLEFWHVWGWFGYSGLN